MTKQLRLETARTQVGREPCQTGTREEPLPSRPRISTLIVCALAMLAVVQGNSTALADEALRFWLVFNLPPADSATGQPSLDAFLETWSHQGIDLYGLRPRASGSVDFQQQLLGQAAILKQLALFRTRNPTFPRIEVTFFGWDEYWESLRSAPSSLRPDLLQIPTTWCSSLARGLGILTALSGEIASEAERRYTHQLIEPCLVYGDRPLYGLPWLIDIRVLYFWKNDLPTLETELRNSRHVRDSFRQVLQSSQAAVDHPLFALPTARDWELLHQTALLVWGEGGNLVETARWFGYHWSSAALKAPALLGAEYLLGLAKDRLIALPRETRQELELKFMNHQLGSVVSGPWLVQELEKRGAMSQGTIGIAPPPLYERDPVTFVGGSLLGLTGRSPALIAPALALTNYLSAGEGALPTALAVGLLPASTSARGTATGAVQRRHALRDGERCKTYFECLVAAGYPETVPETFERVLTQGRTYPSLPDWWTLEVPSRLGSLYHFWQELAALQPRDALDASLQTISEEWDASLMAFHRRLLQTTIAVVITAAVLMVASVRVRRHRRALMARQQQLLSSIADLERQSVKQQESIQALDLLKQMLSELRTKEESSTSRYVKKIGAIVGPLPQERDHFEIVLPTHADRHLYVVKNGRRIEGIDAMAARVIERVMRQSLLEQRRVSFSLLVGALDLWLTPAELPKDARARWEAVVAEMRRAFDSERWEVISKGKNTIYEFMLDESAYECFSSGRGRPQSLESDRRFVTEVRDPFLRATQLAVEDPATALACALEAFAAERDLVMKDIEVVMLACRLATRTSMLLTGQQQAILRDAQEEFSRVRERYRLFFDSYATPERLLQTDGQSSRQGGRELTAHWEKLRRNWHLMEEAASDMPLTVSAAPATIDKAWRRATYLVATLGPKHAQTDDEFIDAYQAILDYWLRTANAHVGIVDELRHRLDPTGKRKHRIKDWVESTFSEAVRMALMERRVGDRAFLLKELEARLIADLWKSVRDGSPHVLLEISGAGDDARQDRIRTSLKAKSAPPDIPTCIESLAEIW